MEMPEIYYHNNISKKYEKTEDSIINNLRGFKGDRHTTIVLDLKIGRKSAEPENDVYSYSSIKLWEGQTNSLMRDLNVSCIEGLKQKKVKAYIDDYKKVVGISKIL